MDAFAATAHRFVDNHDAALNPDGANAEHGPNWARNGSPIGDVAHPITTDQVTVPSFLEDLPPIREEIAHYHRAAQRLDLSFGNPREF